MKMFLVVFVVIMTWSAQLAMAGDQLSVYPSLMNNGFEDVEQGSPKYWTYSGPNDSILLNSKVSNEGKQSVQLSLNGPVKDGIWLLQAVEVEAFKRYDAGGAIKTDGLENGYAQISVTFLDQNGVKISSVDVFKLSGTNEWTYDHKWIESPSGADVAHIKCFITGKGRAWFDSIRFTAKISGGY